VRMSRCWAIWAACVLLCARQTLAISNGDFGAGLTGWNTDANLSYGPVSVVAGQAVLDEDAVLLATTLAQEFVIPAGAQSLSFYLSGSSQVVDSNAVSFPDAFQALLLDPITGVPILSTDPPPSPFKEFFYIDVSGPGSVVYDPSLLTITGQILTLDLMSVPGGTPALLRFELLGSEDGRQTQVIVDDVELSVIPEPVGLICLPLAMAGLAAYIRRRRRSTWPGTE